MSRRRRCSDVPPTWLEVEDTANEQLGHQTFVVHVAPPEPGSPA